MIRSATFAIALLLIPVFALAADLEVTWTAPDDDRITGYKLYHTQSPYWRSYTIVDVGDVTSHMISDYSAGDTFWIAATSYYDPQDITSATDISVDADGGDGGGSAYISTSTDFTTLDWAVDGEISVTGFSDSSNNGMKTIAHIATNTLTVDETLVDEISGASVDMTGVSLESVFSETLRVEVETDGTPTSKELRRLKFSTGSVSAVIGGGSHTINWE